MLQFAFYGLAALCSLLPKFSAAHNDVAIIQFRENSVEIDPFVAQQLDKVFESLPIAKTVEMKVVSKRSVRLNYDKASQFSRKRCESIAFYFLQKGIHQDQLLVNAFAYHVFKEQLSYADFLAFDSPLIFSINVRRKQTKPLMFTHSGFDPFEENCESHFINNRFENEIEHESGALLTLSSSCFESVSGRPFDASVVELRFCVYLSKTDFLKADLTSNATLRWLESGGMAHIEAYSNSEKLKLRSNNSIELFLPSEHRFKRDMTAFTGQEQYGLIDWEPSQPNQVRERSSMYVPEVVDDEWSEDEYLEYEFEETEGYFMELTNLGWINCDRFLDIETPTDLIVKVKGTSAPMAVRLVFKTENSLLPGYQLNQNGLVKWEGIPSGDKVSLVVYGKEGSDYFWATKEIILGQIDYEEIQPQVMTKAQMRSEMEKL